MYPFERFTEAAKGALALAQEEAEGTHHGHIGTEHLLFGLLRQDGTVAAESLARIGVDEVAVRTRIEQVLGSDVRVVAAQNIPTTRTKKVIEMSFREARAAGSRMVRTDHILLALVDEGEGIAAHVLAELGATVELVRSTSEEVRSEGIDEETAPRRMRGGSPRPLSLGRPETPTRMELAMLGARDEALLDSEDEESEVHLFRYLLRSPVPRIAHALKRFGVDPAQLREAARPPERVLELRRALDAAVIDKRAAATREDYPAAEAALQRERQLREELDAAEAAWQEELSAED